VKKLLLIGAGVVALASAASAQPYYPPAYGPVPPPRYEAVPPPPGERVVWRPGHWRWDGVRYDWIPGHYVERPVVANRWIPGHWVNGPRGPFWVEAHWE
jgi:hypothetical protein